MLLSRSCPGNALVTILPGFLLSLSLGFWVPGFWVPGFWVPGFWVPGVPGPGEGEGEGEVQRVPGVLEMDPRHPIFLKFPEKGDPFSESRKPLVR